MTPETVKEKVEENNRPYPNCVPVQAASTPNTRASTPEDGEILDFEEDWDSPEGERRRKVRKSEKVSNNTQSDKRNYELRENKIETFINERVNTILSEKGKLRRFGNFD